MKPSGKSGGKPGDKITGLCIEQRPVCLWSGGSSPRRDAPEVAVGMVAVPKTGQKNASPRRDASGAPVGKVSVPKTVQKPPSPREDAPEVPVGGVAVAEGQPKIGHRSDSVGFRETLPFPWHRLDVRNRVYGYGLFQAGIWS